DAQTFGGDDGDDDCDRCPFAEYHPRKRASASRF
ncbi:unnamed protein product, partial [Mesorhabditis belari]